MDEENSASREAPAALRAADWSRFPLAVADAAMADRFDARVMLTLRAMSLVHALLLTLDALMGNIDEFWMWQCVMLCCAATIIFTTRDAIRAFIFSHVCWTFSFATYVYAFAALRPVREGLEEPALSSSIAVASQLGLLLGYFCSRPPRNSVSLEVQSNTLSSLVPISTPLIGIGLLGVAADYLEILDPIYVLTLKMFLFLALGLRLLDKGQRFLRDPLFIFTSFAIIFQSISSNVRSDSFGLLLFLGFVALLVARRIASIGKLLIAVLAWRIMSVFSMISLSARADQWSSGGDAGAIAASRLFSMEAFNSFINPFSQPSFYQRIDGSINPMRSSFFVTGDGITDRLVLLPYMDKFLSLYPRTEGIKVGEIWNLFLSILPSFGQAKDLILSDRLTWEIGARAIGNVGRPLLTAEAEVYIIGGHWFVFLFSAVMFSTQYIMFRFTLVATRSRVISILFFSQLFVNTIFSTTALSVALGTIRSPLQILVVLFFIKAAALQVRYKQSNGR